MSQLQSDSEKNFIGGLVAAVPQWATGAIGTLLTFALVMKIIGIDFAGPINGISEAYTQAIQAQASGMQNFTEATDRMALMLDDQRKSFNELNASISEKFAEQEAMIADNSEAVRDVYDIAIKNTARIEVLEKSSHPKAH